ncbi:MAG: RidA family protein, partial [Pseudolabrys sp.]
MTVTKIQPKTLFQRALEGRVLYTHVVVAETQSLIFNSGQLARDKSGNIVGPRDMRRQVGQVGENLRLALEAVGATLADLVKTTTFVTDIDEFFRHVDVPTIILVWVYRPVRRSRSVDYRIRTLWSR